MENSAAEQRKLCSKCGAIKALDDFFKDPRAKDGRRSSCKSCVSLQVKDYKARNKDAVAERHRKWCAANKERVRVIVGKYNKKNRELLIERTRRWRLLNPEKNKAHMAVHNAIKYGRLVPSHSCSACGASGRTEAHHDDYSKPLEVRWLCKECHVAADKIMRAALKG